MAEDTEIEDQDLSAVIASELRQARGYDDAELNGKRTKAIEYKRGDMRDVPARPNGSQVTDRTFADTMQWILPGVVRVFVAADQMVKYDKVREENDEWSREATEYTNYSFFRQSDGYNIVYNAAHDALMFGNGLASSYWEAEKVETKIFRDKTEMELAALLDEGWQPTGVVKPGKARTDLVDDGMGDYVEAEVPTLTVKLQKVEQAGRICDKTCKPENLLIDSTATTIEEARFVAYLHDDVTRSDLMEMAEYYGWDKEEIAELPSFNRVSDSSEVQTARESTRPLNAESTLKSGDIIGLYECYIRADKDGDGVAELLQAWWAGDIGGGKLLGEPEEWEDDVPYTDIPCYPVPHSFVAESVFDRTEDIQRVKTVLTRGLLDNLYSVALPMREAEAASVLNPDILANPKFGATIWRKQGTMATAPIIDHVIPFVGDKILAGLQYLDDQVAKRTGVSRTTMALDPEALQNQTATASQQQRDAGYSQIELIARNMAEKGWTKFFAKRLKLAQRHGLVATIPTKEKEGSGFRQVDASKWDANMAVAINTGLGTGSRDRDMAMLNNILNGQVGMADRLGAAGMTTKAIEFLPKIRNTAVKLAESSGLKNPEEFYPEITDEEVEAMKAQAEEAKSQPPLEVQLEQLKGANAEKLKTVDAQVTMQQAEMKARGDVVKNEAELQADLQTNEAERQNAIALEQVKQQHEDRRFFAKLEQERELEILKLNAVEVEETTGGEPGPDGKPTEGKKRTKKRVVDNNTALMDGISQLGQMLAQMSANMSAPTEIVRGPDGRAVGTRKVLN